MCHKVAVRSTLTQNFDGNYNLGALPELSDGFGRQPG